MIVGLFESGRKHPAACSLPSLIISAPSWSGAGSKKILRIRNVEGLASIITPVDAISPSFVLRSNTISAPVLLRDISAAAEATAAIAAVALSSRSPVMPMNDRSAPLPPIFSSAERGSG